MPTLEIVALSMLGVGLVMFTIGGMIDFRTNYSRHNDALLKGFKAVSKNPLNGFQTGPDPSNPKSRWLVIPGFALFVGGMLLMILT